MLVGSLGDHGRNKARREASQPPSLKAPNAGKKKRGRATEDVIGLAIGLPEKSRRGESVVLDTRTRRRSVRSGTLSHDVQLSLSRQMIRKQKQRGKSGEKAEIHARKPTKRAAGAK